MPLAQDDFADLCEVMDMLITSENESYACVLVGRAKRQGSGVASEAGVSTEQNILKIVTEKHKNGPWRVKKFRGSHSPPRVG